MPKVTVLTSLYNCHQFLEGYFKALEKIENSSEMEVLLLHNSPKKDEIYIIEKYLIKLAFVKHIVISERENLYATWNRGIELAKGRYITVWNADDIRLPSSVDDQVKALERYPEAALSYGNFTIVNEYGRKEGRNVVEPDFHSNFESFLRVHHIGCFPMWRKEIHKDIGYFDEQFKLVADLDFQIRVSLKYPLVKVNKNLGYYLENTPSNLSSNRKLQRTERTALNMRYGNYDLLHLPYLYSSLKAIDISMFRWLGNVYNIADWSDRPSGFSLKRAALIFVSVFNLPLDILRYIKYSAFKF